MNGKDLLMIGEAIRDYRKQKGLRLEDLADEHISISTISNIERGFTHVKEGKLTYLLKKLGIEFQDLTELENIHQKKERILTLQLNSARAWIESGNAEKAYQVLKQINLVDTHPQKQYYLFVKGLYFFSRNLYKKAKNEWNSALRLGREKTNRDVEALIYLYLGKIAMIEENPEEALNNVQEGIKVCSKDEKANHVYMSLLLDQIRYLRYLKKDWEVMILIEEVWEKLPKDLPIQLRLELYLERAELFVSHSVWDKALEVVEEGIELARQNQEWGLLSKFWYQLGVIYDGLKEVELAQICYQSVGVIEQKLPTKSVWISSLLLLASLHFNQKEYEEAVKLLQKALHLSEKENRPKDTLEVYLKWGDVAMAQELYKDAEQYYQQAYLLAKSLNLPEKETEVLYRLARLAKVSDYSKYQAYAIQLLEKQTEVLE